MEDRLRKFARLVEAGSFTAAAQAMHISQPALTVAINKLERELGAQLLVRGPRSCTVTLAGQLAYASAKQLIVTAANLKNSLINLAGDVPTATIGLIDSLASMLFAAQPATDIDSFDSQLKLSVLVNNSRYLVNATRHDELDIAFVTEQPPSVSDLLVVNNIGVEPLVLVCHPSQKMAVEKQLRSRQAVRFISYDQPSTSFQLIQAGLAEHNISVTPIFYSSSPEIMLELVLRAKGVSVLPYFLVRQLLADRRLAIVTYTTSVLINRPISSLSRRGKTLPAGLEQLPLIIQQMLARQVAAASLL